MILESFTPGVIATFSSVARDCSEKEPKKVVASTHQLCCLVPHVIGVGILCSKACFDLLFRAKDCSEEVREGP